jgi:hypothetical protein
MAKGYLKGCRDVVSYAEIIKGLSDGLSIAQQLKKFNISESPAANGRANAVKKKVLKVYNVDFAIHGTGKEHPDPDFVKMHLDDGTFWDLLDLIQNTEIKKLDEVMQ